jgi:hypothetical protein
MKPKIRTLKSTPEAGDGTTSVLAGGRRSNNQAIAATPSASTTYIGVVNFVHGKCQEFRQGGKTRPHA